jgi:hypothetical protein
MILASASLAIIALAVYATWSVLTPVWVFGLATDKTAYGLGEDVQIIVTLENHGFISHPITAAIANPVFVAVYAVAESNPTITTQVWYSHYVSNETTFTVSPSQPLLRTFVWNQTNFVNPGYWNTTYKAGTYLIEAFIPKSGAGWPALLGPKLFSAYVYINVTAS